MTTAKTTVSAIASKIAHDNEVSARYRAYDRTDIATVAAIAAKPTVTTAPTVARYASRSKGRDLVQ